LRTIHEPVRVTTADENIHRMPPCFGLGYGVPPQAKARGHEAPAASGVIAIDSEAISECRYEIASACKLRATLAPNPGLAMTAKPL